MSPAEWLTVARNAVWIAGAALVLSSWSWQRWVRLNDPGDERRSYAVTIAVGIVLFCAGLGLTVTHWFERIAASAALIAAAADLVWTWRKTRFFRPTGER